MTTIFMAFDHKIPSKATLAFSHQVSQATRLYRGFSHVVAMAKVLSLGFSHKFDTAIPIYMQHDHIFHGMSAVSLAFDHIFHCFGEPAAIEFAHTFHSYGYDIAILPFDHIVGAKIEAYLQALQFSVTIAGVRVGIQSFTFDRNGFANAATLTVRDRAQVINKHIGDPVTLMLLGEQYELMIVNKPFDEQTGSGSYSAGYVIECASITAQLSEGINPDISASRITHSFPSGTMATAALNILTDGVCEYFLGVQDFRIGAFEFDDSERYAAIRQIFPAEYGWIIETSKNGVLEIKPWQLPEIGGTGQKALMLSNKSLTPPSSVLYNQVEVRNFTQNDGTTGLTLEVVDNGNGTGKIYGYSVPWSAAFSIFDSEDAQAPSLLIVGGVVEEVEVEDTDVEFVDYSASLSKPCYSDPVIDWGNNDSLSPVTYTESGALTTATEPGYSVAVKAAYTTRRKVWTFDNRKTDTSQVRIKYD